MVKFFLVMRTCPSLAAAALGAVAAFGLVIVWLNPTELDSALGLILLAQMFLASSGFATRARRGHFDSLLVHGMDRYRVLVAHWGASALPGAVAWFVVVAAAWWMRSPAAGSALAGERLVAFLIVSALAWSAGFLLPRGAAGALWMGGLAALLVRHADILPPGADSIGSVMALRHAAAVVLCPFLLIGVHPRLGATEIAAAGGMAATLLLCTWRLGAGLDVYLAERT